MLTRVLGAVVAIVFMGMLAFPFGVGVAWIVGHDVEPMGGNAPPPYNANDVNTAIVNSLGNAGRTEGYAAPTINVVAAADLLSDTILVARGGAAMAAEVESLTVYPYIREVVVTLTEDPAATNGALCLRLGPATDGGAGSGNPDGAPALTCPDVNASGNTGGCYLTSLGQSCAFMIRPRTSGCTSYDTCHVPLWIQNSASGNTLGISVALIW